MYKIQNNKLYKQVLSNLLYIPKGGQNTMESSRPLDALNEARDKRVIVELKNNKQYVGKLKSFDIHINTVLENAEERIEGELKRKIGTAFIRGDTIVLISIE